jgi:hypothetical protein
MRFVIPARFVSRFTIRSAAYRSIRRPFTPRKIGPLVRSSTFPDGNGCVEANATPGVFETISCNLATTALARGWPLQWQSTGLGVRAINH